MAPADAEPREADGASGLIKVVRQLDRCHLRRGDLISPRRTPVSRRRDTVEEP
jgi:hypothetical protein